MMYSLFKETKICQVCKKSFSNGKALRGHMRSHTLKLSTESETGSIPSSLTTFNKRGANFRPHETVLMRSVNTSEVVGGLNKEDEQQVTAERIIVVELDEVSSTESQYCLTVEEAAYCLLQMSKDKWPQNLQNPKSIVCLVSTRKRKDTENYIEIDSKEDHEGSYKYVNEDGDVKFSTSYVEVPTEDNDESDDDDDDDDDDYDDEEDAYAVAEEKKCKKKYMCDICGKALRSHQALGGHRTSHGNKRLKISDKNGKATSGPVFRRHFECQICGRAFASGQALGGHKKIHYAFLQPTN